MCDFSGRLIAWMDGELEANDATVLEEHVHACGECRERVVAYGEVSRGFAAYCDAVLETAEATKAHRKLPRWAPVAAAAAAIAAVVLLLALAPRSSKPAPLVRQVAQTHPVASEAAAPEIASRRFNVVQRDVVHRRHVAAHRKASTANREWAGPAIEIAIPADAMFPPGAVPEGVNYVAEVSLADGSVQGLRLQP